MSKVIGRFFGSDTIAEKIEDSWKVTVVMREKLLVEGDGDWKIDELTTTCTDDSFDSAYQVAMNATLQKFNDRLEETGGFGLFKNPDADDEAASDEETKG